MVRAAEVNVLVVVLAKLNNLAEVKCEFVDGDVFDRSCTHLHLRDAGGRVGVWAAACLETLFNFLVVCDDDRRAEVPHIPNEQV